MRKSTNPTRLANHVLLGAAGSVGGLRCRDAIRLACFACHTEEMHAQSFSQSCKPPRDRVVLSESLRPSHSVGSEELGGQQRDTLWICSVTYEVSTSCSTSTRANFPLHCFSRHVCLGGRVLRVVAISSWSIPRVGLTASKLTPRCYRRVFTAGTRAAVPPTESSGGRAETQASRRTRSVRSSKRRGSRLAQ